MYIGILSTLAPRNSPGEWELSLQLLNRLVQINHVCDFWGKWYVVPDQCLIIAALQGDPVPIHTTIRHITHGYTLFSDHAPDNRGSLVAILWVIDLKHDAERAYLCHGPIRSPGDISLPVCPLESIYLC